MFFSFYSFARLIAYFRYFLFSSSFILISFYSVLFRLCNFLFIISVTRPFSLSFCLLSALNFFLFFSSFFSASFVPSQCPFVGLRFIFLFISMTLYFLLIIKKYFYLYPSFLSPYLSSSLICLCRFVSSHIWKLDMPLSFGCTSLCRVSFRLYYAFFKILNKVMPFLTETLSNVNKKIFC